MKAFYFLVFFLLFFSLGYAKCIGNYHESISYINNTLMNETVYCEFGCSSAIDACKPSPFTSLFFIVIFGAASFLLLGFLDFPFNIYTSVFFLSVAILAAASDVLSSYSRIVTILYILIYISFMMVKLLRRDKGE